MRLNKQAKAIVDTYNKMLLNNLRAHGFNAVGLAGGVVFSDTKEVHAYMMVFDDVTVNDGEVPFDRDKFMTDIGNALCAGAEWEEDDS
jgi:hypothetical protein